jgi:site-specific DNA recombinase
MHVVGYIRVSTTEQAHAGVSLEVQRAKLDAYAMIKDWTMVEVIRDEGVSAKSLKRPGLERLLALVRAGTIEAVIVYKLDRLTRSVTDLGALMKVFERKGVALVSLQESLDATTATGELMMNLLISVSQWERKVIGERTRDAMQHLKAQGQRYCRPVFDNAGILVRMRRARAEGRSYHQIAGELNAEDIPTARGGQWHACTVRQILQRRSPPARERVA